MIRFISKFKKPTSYQYGKDYFKSSIDSDFESMIEASSRSPYSKIKQDKYFACLKAIKESLLGKTKFIESTPVFYINSITVKLKYSPLIDSIRLCYFSIDPRKTKKILNKFAKKQKELKLLSADLFEKFNDIDEKPVDASKNEKRLSNDKYLDSCKPLYWLTHIGLDLVGCNDFSQIRARMVKYRQSYNSAYCPGKSGFSKPVLEPIFSKYSEFFKKMDSSDIDRLWKELDGENRTNHHIVNMLYS